MNSISRIVQDKISAYDPSSNLGHTARLMLALSLANHEKVEGHLERVGLLAEAVALKLQKDVKAAFFAGLLHDLGKVILPAELFCGRDITAEEYELVKTHAMRGFEVLGQFHEFTAMCAGLHHAMYQKGYGLTAADFPTHWSPATIKKVLEISTIISICDFIDAYSTRKTTPLDGSQQSGKSLATMLAEKYPDDLQTIDIALEAAKQIYQEQKTGQ